MSSILTNNGAMVALQTLKGINANLAKTQDQISTGKDVNTAKDNAAIWAIAKTMETDVSSFKAIDQTLSIGQSTVGVARAATESVADLLGKVKTKIIAAQEAGTSAEDRAKIQTDIDAMKAEIGSIVGTAQFNGKNLLNGTTASPMEVTSSLDRAADGTVTAGKISVATADLRSAQLQSAAVTATDGGGVVNLGAALAFQGGAGAIALTSASANQSDLSAILAGDRIEMTVNGKSFGCVVEVGDTAAALVGKLNTEKSNAGVGGTLTEAGGQFSFDAGTGGGDFDVRMNVNRGGLGNLVSIDVTEPGGAALALRDIEGLMKVAVDAAASFGSSQGRIETQRDFIGKLTDAMKTGIGALVDADMEEASARLQALQVQQQLATQSLSIANQAPQALLSLFR